MIFKDLKKKKKFSKYWTSYNLCMVILFIDQINYTNLLTKERKIDNILDLSFYDQRA